MLALVAAAPRPAGAADPEAAARGAYIAASAGCEECHTDMKNGGRPFAGGRKFETRFGAVSSPNLTPDATGLGRWSAADFGRAMRWGIAPDDSHYQTLFPFPFYNRLTDADLADLKAFLDNLAPVSRRNDSAVERSVSFGRTRNALGVAAQPFRGPWTPDPARDAVWNRGNYLVASIGRCGDCHTPRDALGIPVPGHFLAGTRAGPDGKKVPNITPDPQTGIGDWSEDDIAALLQTGQTPDFDFVGGSMAEIVKSTAHLTDADRHAISVYLRTIPAILATPARIIPKKG
ncbi:MAG: cytochrome c [Alphaproteobacteria bacterium]|nr:cytochrome c [Alphaproteobacteria bacterium]